MAVLVRCCSVGVLANDNSSLTKETRLLQSFFKYISLSADVKRFTPAIFMCEWGTSAIKKTLATNPKGLRPMQVFLQLLPSGRLGRGQSAHSFFDILSDTAEAALATPATALLATLPQSYLRLRAVAVAIVMMSSEMKQ